MAKQNTISKVKRHDKPEKIFTTYITTKSQYPAFIKNS